MLSGKSRRRGLMRAWTATLVGVIALFLTVAATAPGALPRKGATLVGVIKSSPFAMTINIGVSPKGTLSHFTYLCGTGRAPTSVYNLPVDRTGHFAYTSKLRDWKMAGHFVTPTTAFVSLNSIACGGSKGSTTIKLK
jgi:hypothetical protein